MRADQAHALAILGVKLEAKRDGCHLLGWATHWSHPAIRARLLLPPLEASGLLRLVCRAAALLLLELAARVLLEGGSLPLRPLLLPLPSIHRTLRPRPLPLQRGSNSTLLLAPGPLPVLCKRMEYKGRGNCLLASRQEQHLQAPCCRPVRWSESPR